MAESEMTAKEWVHRAIDELSDDEVEVFYKVFIEQRKHQPPGRALSEAFEVVYRAREDRASR
jgi:DNA-directed RNA polymerase specialized sigma24 family protein